jgi:putative SOS response-associated peptidase YedK
MPWFIRLRDHKLDLVAGLMERSQRGHGELGRAGED